MKAAVCVLIGLAVIMPAIYGLPARTNDAEVIAVVPLEKQNRPVFPNFNFGGGFDGVIDTGSDEIDDDIFGGSSAGGGAYNPFQFDFGGLLHSLDAYMRRLRDRFSNVWTRVPYPDSDTDVGLGIVGNNDKGNTTSKVEIIDGHKVIVNDTVYTKNTDFGTSVVKVRTVEVVPNDDEDTKQVDATSKPAIAQKPTHVSTTPRDVEQDSDEVTVMSSRPVDQSDNEIEMLDTSSHLAPVTTVPNRRQPDASVMESMGSSSEEMPANGNRFQYNPIMHELSRYQEEMDRRHDAQQLYYANHFQPAKAPTWESFEDVFEPNRQQHFEHSPNYHQFDDSNNNNKYDLSNDIAINQMLADQGAPINPDAEFIQPVQQQQQQQQPQQYNGWPANSEFYSKYETIKK